MLLPDLMDPVSFGSPGPSPLESIAELRGLSVFPDPGILDRSDLKDRVESLVSVLAKEGYCCRSPGPELGLLPGAAPPSFELWLPILPELSVDNGRESIRSGLREIGLWSPYEPRVRRCTRLRPREVVVLTLKSTPVLGRVEESVENEEEDRRGRSRTR